MQPLQVRFSDSQQQKSLKKSGWNCFKRSPPAEPRPQPPPLLPPQVVFEQRMTSTFQPAQSEASSETSLAQQQGQVPQIVFPDDNSSSSHGEQEIEGSRPEGPPAKISKYQSSIDSPSSLRRTKSFSQSRAPNGNLSLPGPRRRVTSAFGSLCNLHLQHQLQKPSLSPLRDDDRALATPAFAFEL